MLSAALNLLDPYVRRARVYPALIASLPSFLTAVAISPDLLGSSAAMKLTTLALPCGVLYFLGSTTRSAGKRQEQRLLKQWGGWPTTIMLRHSGPLDPHTRERYHTFLSELVGLKLPSEKDEKKKPADADARYASAIISLKEKARGAKYPLVEKENTEYGFRRNLRGLRILGVVLSLMGTIVLTADIMGWALPANAEEAIRLLRSAAPIKLAALIVHFFALIIWLLVVNDRWVREAGDNYAKALLAVCDQHKAK